MFGEVEVDGVEEEDLEVEDVDDTVENSAGR